MRFVGHISTHLDVKLTQNTGSTAWKEVTGSRIRRRWENYITMDVTEI